MNKVMWLMVILVVLTASPVLAVEPHEHRNSTEWLGPQPLDPVTHGIGKRIDDIRLGRIFGGHASARAQFLHNGQSGDPSGLTFCNPGVVVDFYRAGGGGYGNSLERDPEEVKRDVMLGYVSIQKARRDYGVVIDPENHTIDLAETQKLRASRISETDD